MARHIIWPHSFLPDIVLAMLDVDAVADELRRFYRRSHQRLDRVMREQGVSFSRTKLLLFVEREGFVRSTDIAETFGHTPRTVTEAIDALERDGLLRRDPDPVDRRAKRVSITAAGSAAVRASEPSRRAFLDDVFGTLDEGEIDQLARLLGKLNARLEARDDAPAARRAAGGGVVDPSSRSQPLPAAVLFLRHPREGGDPAACIATKDAGSPLSRR